MSRAEFHGLDKRGDPIWQRSQEAIREHFHARSEHSKERMRRIQAEQDRLVAEINEAEGPMTFAQGFLCMALKADFDDAAQEYRELIRDVYDAQKNESVYLADTGMDASIGATSKPLSQ